MRRFSITTMFWALVGVYVVVLGTMMFPPLTPTILRVFIIPLMFISWAIFFALGLALIVSIIKRKEDGPRGWLKRFLLLTGASAVGFPVFGVLHNLVYGLFIYFFGQDFWERTGLDDEPVFFFLALIAVLSFLVGVIGTIVLLKKRKRQ